MPTPSIKISITDDDIEAANRGAGSSGPPAPAGFYDAEVARCDYEEPQAKNKRFHVQYKIINSDQDYGWVHEYIVLTDASKWKLTQYLVATGQIKGSGDVDVAKAMPKTVGKVVRLRVNNESYTPPPTTQNPEPETRMTAKPGGVWLPGKGNGASSGSAGDDQLTEWQNMTEDELEAAEDAIRAYGKTVDVDPDDYSTWADVIEAFSANGAEPEPADDTTTEESPEADERWSEILGMGEDELAEIADELDEYGEPLGLASADYEQSSWEEFREAINDAMNSGDGDDSSDDTGDQPEDYTTWSIPDLKNELKARDLAVDGAKAVLVKRLTDHDAEVGPFGAG